MGRIENILACSSYIDAYLCYIFFSFCYSMDSDVYAYIHVVVSFFDRNSNSSKDPLLSLREESSILTTMHYVPCKRGAATHTVSRVTLHIVH